VHALLEAAGRRPAAVLLTHPHIDHAMAAGDFSGEEIPVFVHPADALAFHDPVAWGAGFENPLRPVKDLRTITDGEVLRIAGLAIEVLHTPGHTPGHCIFRTDADDDLLLSGDLVFAGAIGRSDFPNSSPTDMAASLRRFLGLPDGLPVLPGHGPTTDVGHERASNPFLRDIDAWS
jgi:hydroxyacylglutathione hydrolase